MKDLPKCALLLALLPGPACIGQSAAGPRPPQIQSPEFVVPSAGFTGMVHDPSGKPAPGVLVTFHPGRYPNAPDYFETRSDQNGRFVVVLQYRNARGFAEGPINPTNLVMARNLEGNLAAIAEFSEAPTNLLLDLQPGITFSGSVKDTEGAPVTNATVDLRILSGHSFQSLEPQPAKVDARGSFTFPALPEGREYYLVNGITAQGFGTAGSLVKAEDARSNRYEFPVFVLKRADRILAGQVLGQDGNPVAGALVSFYGQGQPQRTFTNSDIQGRFVFDPVCEGPVTVSANLNNSQGNTPAQGGDTNVVLRLGVNLANNNGRNSRPARKITGTVRDPSGSPAVGVTLYLISAQPTPIKNLTDSSGRYAFTWQPLAVGDQRSYPWLLARDAHGGLAAIQTVDEKTTNLDLNLKDGLTLSTQVKDSNGRTIKNPTATLTIWQGDRGTRLDPLSFDTDDNGHLRLTALPQGLKYWVQVEAPGYTTQTLYAEAEDTKTNCLALPTCILDQADRLVSGVVLDAAHHPLSNVRLTLFATGTTAKTATSDYSGRFVFDQVTRGPFNVSATATGFSGTAAGKGGDTNTEILVLLQPSTNRIPSRGPATITSATTSGKILDPSGAPASGVSLSVLGSINLNPLPQSDSSGQYTIRWQTLNLRSNNPAKPTLLARDPAHNLVATAELDSNSTSPDLSLIRSLGPIPPAKAIVELDLHLQPGLILSGAVRDPAGQPVTNAVVQVVPYPPAELRSALNRLPPTNASPQGIFSISALPPGVPFLLHVAADGYGSNNIPVPASDTRTNQLQLPPVILKVANRIVAGQVLGPDDKPCWGAQMSLQGGEGQPAGHPSTTDANGHFSIKGVCEGSLDVRAMLPAGNGNPRFLVGIARASGGDANILIKLGQSNGVPFTGPGGAALPPANPLPPY